MRKIDNFDNDLLCILRTDPPVTLVIKKSGNRFTISNAESHILQKLIEHKEVVSKDELLAVGWDNPEAIGENSLPVAVSNLRKVLKNEGLDITNLPRRGYKIDITSAEVCESPEINDKRPRGARIKLKLTALQKVLRKTIVFILALLTLLLLHISFTMIEGWVSVDCDNNKKVKMCQFEGNNYEIL
ncbi:helix-turn-helix domain-containing protein [Vibrio chagasii]|uniref:winged helix-turn-helix domain-containing protein n=1 Tax=Vibrio chagasii TaxID=170679 RepID=UPI0038CD3E7E